MDRESRNRTIDRIRKEVDRNALRARNGIRMVTGIQRTDVGLSPKDVVWERGRTQLWRYRSDQVSFRPPLLIVYSLVNRSYIFDLRPGNSVVEQLIAAGFDVYMLDWGIADERDAGNTLEDYVDGYIPAAVRRVRAISGCADVNLIGYCMGGLLATLYAARHLDAPLRSLTAIATPADLQQLRPLVDIMMSADLETLLGRDGLVPASALMQGFRALAPTGEITGTVDLIDRLWNADYVTAHQALSGWATDQVPLPGGVARQMKRLAVDNAVLADRVLLGGDPVRLGDIKIPFLQVLGTRDHIVPLSASAPLIDLVGSPEKEELRLDGGHVGLLVGRSAAKNTIPTITEFLRRQSEALT